MKNYLLGAGPFLLAQTTIYLVKPELMNTVWWWVATILGSIFFGHMVAKLDKVDQGE